MAATKKTEMVQNGVSEKPKIEEAELNGNQQDVSGRVVPPRGRKEEGEGDEGRVAQYPVCSFFVFSPSISPQHFCLNVTVLVSAGLHSKQRCTYNSLCVQAQLYAVSPPVGRNPCSGEGLLGGLNAALIDWREGDAGQLRQLPVRLLVLLAEISQLPCRQPVLMAVKPVQVGHD